MLSARNLAVAVITNFSKMRVKRIGNEIKAFFSDHPSVAVDCCPDGQSIYLFC